MTWISVVWSFSFKLNFLKHLLIVVVSSCLLTPLIYLFIHPEVSAPWFCFEKLQENSCGGFSFWARLQTPAHVFSCEFCEINKMYFVEKLRTTASEHRIYILLIFVLILRQNRYLPLNSDHLLGKQRTILRYRSQPSKISYLRFGDIFYFLPSDWLVPRSLSVKSANVGFEDCWSIWNITCQFTPDFGKKALNSFAILRSSKISTLLTVIPSLKVDDLSFIFQLVPS